MQGYQHSYPKSAYPNSQPCLMYLETLENESMNATPKRNLDVQRSLFTSQVIYQTPGSLFTGCVVQTPSSISNINFTPSRTNSIRLGHQEATPPRAINVSASRQVGNHRSQSSFHQPSLHQPSLHHPRIRPAEPQYFPRGPNAYPAGHAPQLVCKFSQPPPPRKMVPPPLFQNPNIAPTYFQYGSPSFSKSNLGLSQDSAALRNPPPLIVPGSPVSPCFDLNSQNPGFTSSKLDINEVSELTTRKNGTISDNSLAGSPSLEAKAKRNKHAESQLEEFLLKSRHAQEKLQASITAKKSLVGRLS